MRTNQPIRDSDAIISPGALERLGDEVVKFCDDFEPHGLVDYQMGFWEEEIMDRECSWTFGEWKPCVDKPRSHDSLLGQLEGEGVDRWHVLK